MTLKPTVKLAIVNVLIWAEFLAKTALAALVTWRSITTHDAWWDHALMLIGSGSVFFFAHRWMSNSARKQIREMRTRLAAYYASIAGED